MNNNNIIVKNTLVLYVRTLLILFVSLYTSRVVLNVLGVEDYGIYNAVGGVVAMFSIISGALSTSISRYITYELGKNNTERLSTIFCTSVNVLIFISLIIIVLGELFGVWFLNTKMNIPEERIGAANWVLQCALLSFVFTLSCAPYNACIIAHERMQAFAYISIFEALLKLGVVFLLSLSPFDHLVSYAILLAIASLIVRTIYATYCVRHFQESKYHFIYDKKISRELLGFSGWNFLTNGVMVFNTQGVSILVNLYFGVAMNAARGIATQVEGAVINFVSGFMTSINPQIIKSYAAGDKDRMFMLVCRGAKFMFFLLFILALPIIMEADVILILWLKTPPEYATLFVRLSLIALMANVIGNTAYTACQATGNIKWYSIWVTSVGSLSFLITWLVYWLGAPVESTYIVFLVIFSIIDIIRLFMMKKLLGFPIMMFIKDVFIKVTIVSIVSTIIPFIVIYMMPSSYIRLIVSILTCFISCGITMWSLGLKSAERTFIKEMVVSKYNTLLRRKHK